MTWIISLLARWGLPESIRRPLAYAGSALAAFALLWALWAILAAREEADDKANREAGAAVQREADLRETMERVETANATRDEVRDRGSRARFDQCLRSARTPANCERFLPGGAAPDD